MKLRKTKAFGIFYNHNITVGEDWLLLAQLVNKGNRFVIDQNCYYKYNKQNESSCTNSITSATFSSLFAAYNMICNLFDVENQTVDEITLALRQI